MRPTLFSQGITAAGIPVYLPQQTAVFFTGTEVILTQGVFCRISAPLTDPGISTQIQQQMAAAQHQGIARPVAIGMLPFDRNKPSDLLIPHSYQRIPQATFHQLLQEVSEHSTLLDDTEHPPATRYKQAVASALLKLRHSTLQKVVLARTLECQTDNAMLASALLKALSRQNPGAFCFSVPAADGSVWLGASPELLLEQQQTSVRSMPLAGTAARGQTPAADNAIAAQLLNSEKNRHEHDLVAVAVVNALTPYCSNLQAPKTPTVVSTPKLLHLASEIRGELKQPAHCLDLLRNLHPTPAVCGHPQQSAYQAIAELEPFEREHFAGTVGWCDSEGNAQWAVTIRCAKVTGSQARLYAGAGIVADSHPDAEYAETAAKLGTMLNALGICEAGEPA